MVSCTYIHYAVKGHLYTIQTIRRLVTIKPSPSSPSIMNHQLLRQIMSIEHINTGVLREFIFQKWFSFWPSNSCFVLNLF